MIKALVRNVEVVLAGAFWILILVVWMYDDGSVVTAQQAASTVTLTGTVTSAELSRTTYWNNQPSVIQGKDNVTITVVPTMRIDVDKNTPVSTVVCYKEQCRRLEELFPMTLTSGSFYIAK